MGGKRPNNQPKYAHIPKQTRTKTHTPHPTPSTPYNKPTHNQPNPNPNTNRISPASNCGWGSASPTASPAGVRRAASRTSKPGCSSRQRCLDLCICICIYVYVCIISIRINLNQHTSHPCVSLTPLARPQSITHFVCAAKSHTQTKTHTLSLFPPHNPTPKNKHTPPKQKKNQLRAQLTRLQSDNNNGPRFFFRTTARRLPTPGDIYRNSARLVAALRLLERVRERERERESVCVCACVCVCVCVRARVCVRVHLNKCFV
jgi:hypothetical protein